jgi:non-ribosomal peptide synthetase component E (peptide arylation enzyme)
MLGPWSLTLRAVMLDGVTPFPAEFAARYTELGYWQDRPLFDGFAAPLAR